MRWMVFVHRWIGVGLCLLFAMWFASGIVMIYVPFPSLSEAERLAGSAALDLAGVNSPIVGAVERTAGDVDRLRLVQSPPGRPVLVVETLSGESTAYFADSLETMPPLTESDAWFAAEQFSRSRASRVVGPFDFDQWVVHQAFDRYRPYFRVDLSDARATSVYVSQRTGEIVQRTTRWQRRWNYVGAVAHWIYPTVIRKNWILWDGLVWWLSLFGLVGTSLGIVLGVVRLRRASRRGRSGLASPFVGWLRWHHTLGLFAGVVVFTWILSGWLSMDHGRLFSVPEPTRQQVERFRGLDLRDAVRDLSARDLRDRSGAKELEVVAVGGTPAIVERLDGSSRVLTFGDSARSRAIADADIERAVRAAWPYTEIAASRVIENDDVYAHLREGSLGTAVQRFVLADRADTWVHVDLENARIVQVMDRSRRLYRWMFNGLHSLDIPGIIDRRPAWDALMLVLLVVGLAFSATGVVVAYRRISHVTARG